MLLTVVKSMLFDLAYNCRQ